ncbi:MAG: FkbM family methyltransferase [Actinomycetota bacterium]
MARRTPPPPMEHDLRDGAGPPDHGALTESVAKLRAEMAELRREVETLRAGDSRTPVYVGDGTVLAPTHFDRWIYLDTADRSVSPHILTTGTWERGVTRFFQTYLPEGGTYVEVGANYGYYTLQAACLVGDTGRVVAFEPGPRMFSLLERTIDVNGVGPRTTLHEAAVTDAAGTATFYLKGDWHGGSSLYNEADSPWDVTEVEVLTTTLDDALANSLDGRWVDVCKIDAEGAEATVLAGAADLLANPDLVLLVEVHDRAWADLDDDAGRFLAELAQLGFRFWLIEEDGRGVESTAEQVLAAAVVARDVCCARHTPTPRPGFPPLIDG